MSKWDKAAVVAVAFASEFFWIETHSKAVEKDFYFF